MKKMNQAKKIDRNEEVESLKAQLARVLADYDNLRKRTERERIGLEKLAGLKMILKLLPILDILRQAQKHLKDAGLAVAIKDFEDTLNSEGIEEINADSGQDFDEKLHEVVDVLQDSREAGKAKIVENTMSGWRFKSGEIIRHARVKVTKMGGEKK